mmetsp:Transcript_24466/g.43569  ORF Transcript_24466/g.43569 Transcript_24466/m.43569 type:complete len:213 (-) Transcript_24466:314-952(-)
MLGLAIRSSGLPQVADGPDDWEKNCATANNINQVKYVPPRVPLLRTRCHLFQHDESDVVNNLQNQHHEHDLLLPVVEVRLDQRPAGADEKYHSEQQEAFQKRKDVVDDRPFVTHTRSGDEMVTNGFEEHGHRLDNQQHRHHVVDLLHLVATLDKEPGPRASRRSEEQEEREEESRQRLLACAEIVRTRIPEGGVQLEAHRNGRVRWLAARED